MNWAHGRALGGSSIINYMVHTRGNSLDYDRWAESGNPGWSYQDVLPYFLKSEDANLRIQDSQFHRQGGYLSVEDVPYRTESAAAFIAAAQEAGHPYVDYNGKDQMGVSWVQGTTKKGQLNLLLTCAFVDMCLQEEGGAPKKPLFGLQNIGQI